MKLRLLLIRVFAFRLWFERKVRLEGLRDIILAHTGVWFTPFPQKEQVRFVERMSFLLRSRIPLLDCLKILAKQERRTRIRHVYDEVIKHVLHGATLADAFVNVCPTIDPFFIACVRVGERSGSLSENLSYVSQELKKREMLKKKIIGALVYPSFIIVASVCIGGLITAYIFPKIIPIFQSLNIALPLTTRVLLVLSVALTHHGFLIVFGFGAGVVIMVYVFKRSAPMRNFIVKLFLRLPFVGDFLRSRMMSTFTRMYGLLLKSGLSVVESVSIIKETFTNSFVREECEKLRQSVIQGEGIATHLKKTPSIFPFFVADMVGVGERSGSLSEMFLLLSNHFADEVEERIRIFSSLVEPVLMVGMGLAVGFLAISVITPLYQITEHLNG